MSTTSSRALCARLAIHACLFAFALACPIVAMAQSAATDIACRPNGNSTDAVDVQWKDTNSDNADYDLERQDVSGGGWSVVDTLAAGGCNDDDVCVLTDPNAGTTDVYRYRLIAREGSNESPPSTVCREPRWLDSASGNFRIYYRLTECPDIDGDQACTENINSSGSNIHAAQMATIFEQYRTELIGQGFNDGAVFGGAKPFPVDLYPCNNGCANSRGIQVPPAKLEAADYDPSDGSGNDFEYFIPGHELFHKTQGAHGGTADPFYKWVIEGQARAMEDKTCVFASAMECEIWDDEVDKFYDGQMAAYLGQPEVGLQEQSYNAAIFWVKVMEQFANVLSEPELGSDVMVDYWNQSELNEALNDEKDGIGTLNDTLALQLGSSEDFEGVFKTFVAANYAKDYISTPVPAALEHLNYIDEETFPGGTYGTVKLTRSGPLALGEVVYGTHSIDAWGARYFEADPDPSNSVIVIEAEALPATQHDMVFHVFGIQGGQITYQHSETGTSFSHGVSNINPTFDRIALVVGSLGHHTNFEYGFNLGDGLFIQTPTEQFQAAVGEETSPKKFVLRVDVLDEAGDPVSGINPYDFTISVDGTPIHPTINPANSPIVSASFIAGQYWLVVRAPSTPGCDPCDLSVAYADYTDTEVAALDYGPVPDSDNMIVIDRSGSMAGGKIVAAQEAGRLYVDAYDVGDRIGVLSYNDTTELEFGLGPWDIVNRVVAQLAIDNMDPPAGGTASGLGLRNAQQELIDEPAPNPAWSMVLLSDGADTVGDTNDHLPAFISEYEDRVDDGDQVPIVHVVAVGDDADGVALEELVSATNGSFQWLVDVDLGTVSDEEFSNELGEIYRSFAEEVLDEQQVMAARDNHPSGVLTKPIDVDAAASQGIFVAKWSPQTATAPFSQLVDPNGVSAGPPTLNAQGHKVWRIPAPIAGEWEMVYRPCAGAACAQDFLTEAAVVSDLTLDGFLGLELDERQAGRPMPVVALLSDVDPLLGATVVLEVPRTGEVRTMFDDGLHGDGAAGDGFYGATILNTNAAGGYTVVIEADGISPLSGPYSRRKRLSFFMQGDSDPDGDGLPTWWELENGLDPNVHDPRSADPDKDGLTTRTEFSVTKTHPLDPDTDDGGENDGSEVSRGSDPHDPSDDLMSQPSAKAWAGVERVRVRFRQGPNREAGPNSPTIDPTSVDIYGARRVAGQLGPFQRLVASHPIAGGEWLDLIATNWGAPPDGDEYCYCVVAKAPIPGTPWVLRSTPSALTCASPGADPNPPHGELDLVPPMTSVPSVNVVLDTKAYDDPTTEEHQPFDGAILDPSSTQSGVAEMMISNRADFEGASWQAYERSLPWIVEPNEHGRAHVFAKYRDGAGNESDMLALSFNVPEPAVGLPFGLGLLAWLGRSRRGTRRSRECRKSEGGD